jgi:gas vesicle protein
VFIISGKHVTEPKGALMSAGRSGRKFTLSLAFIILGGLFGAGLALLYAPSSGDRTRHYLRMKKEWARRRAGFVTEDVKETMDRFIAEIRDITAQLLESGGAFTREAKADLLKAIEAGKKAMNEERKRFGRGQQT